jgi:hypothetical protein
MSVNIAAPNTLTHPPVGANAGPATGTLGQKTVQSAVPLPAHQVSAAPAKGGGFIAFFSRLMAPSAETLIKRTNKSVQQGLQAAGRQTGQLINALKQPGVNAASVLKLVSGMPHAAGPATRSGVPFATLIKDRVDVQIKQITNLADLTALRNGLNQPPCNQSHDPTVSALRNAVNDKLGLLRNLDFKAVMTSGDPLVKSAFRAHVKADHTSPNMDFLEAVAKFKNLPSLPAAQAMADRFFFGAEPQVDISGPLSTEMRSALTDIRQAQQPGASDAQKAVTADQLLHLFDKTSARVSYETSAGSFTNFRVALSESLPAALQTTAQAAVALNVTERGAEAAEEQDPTKETKNPGAGSGVDTVFWGDLNRAHYTIKDAGGNQANLLDRITYVASSATDRVQQKLASVQQLQQLTGANPAMLMMVTKLTNQSMTAGIQHALASPASPFRLPDGSPGMPVYPNGSEDVSYTLSPGRNGAVVISAELVVNREIAHFMNPATGAMQALDPLGTSFKARLEVTVEANLQVRVSRQAEFECTAKLAA